MSKANPKAIGAFVVGGVALLLAGIVTFGTFKFFEEQLSIVMYFDGDMTGLDVGAPLVSRGVRIGTVTDITLLFNAETRQTSVPVYAEIEPSRFVIEGESKGGGNLPALVREGMRAQLASQSILTGKLLVQLVQRPDTPARVVGGGAGRPEIPTIASEMEQLQTSVEAVLQKVQGMPLAELTQDLRTLTRNANTAVERLQVDNFSEAGRSFADAGRQITEAAKEAKQALNDAQNLMANVGRRVDVLAPAGEAAINNANQAILEMHKRLTEARALLASMQQAAESADHLMTTAQVAIEPGSALHRELVAMLREFSGAARSIRGLADDLERNPESILFGKTSSGRQR